MKVSLLLLILFFSTLGSAQSFELMPGTKRMFVDAQYLKFFNESGKLSLFSRARATAAYGSSETDLFSGAYLNYTTKSGIGATLLGRISSFNSGLDLGIHFFKANRKWLVYALPAVNLNDELLYSWFSILRFTPILKNNWKFYLSLELFSAFSGQGHLSSVQRIRAGLDKNDYQFGLALNLGQSGNRWMNTNVNPGLFLRKQF